MRDFETVVKEYIAKRREQSRIAEEHLRLGLAHAKVNRERVKIEEELLNNFPNETYTAEDGTRLVIGTNKSRLFERVRLLVMGVASTEL